MSPLHAQTALVTGASRSIGQATASRLAADGAFVFVHYAGHKNGADETVLEITKNGGKAHALQADLSKLADITKIFTEIDAVITAQQLSPLSLLVNNAGVYDAGGLESTDEATFDKLFNLNVKGLFFTTQEAVKRMPQGSRIINISSAVTRIAMPDLGTYAATKGAVDNLTLNFAAELGARGITVNAINPGLVATDGTAHMTSDAEMMAYFKQNTALGRVADPADIADAVAFLCTHDARFITGQMIEVSGGFKL